MTQETNVLADEVLFDTNKNELMVTHLGMKRSLDVEVSRVEFRGVADFSVDENLALFKFPNTKKIDIEDGVASVGDSK